MNPYKPFKHITSEEALTQYLNEKKLEKFLKTLEPTPLESFESSIHQIFKQAVNALNQIS
jgi:hypothetical protein